MGFRFAGGALTLLVVMCMCAAGPALAKSDQAAGELKTPCLGDQVSGKAELTEEEMQALEPVLAHYYAMNGSNEALQQLVGNCAVSGCRGIYLADIVGFMIPLMKAGKSDMAAAGEIADAPEAVCQHCRENNIEVTPEILVRGVRARMDTGNGEGKGKVVY